MKQLFIDIKICILTCFVVQFSLEILLRCHMDWSATEIVIVIGKNMRQFAVLMVLHIFHHAMRAVVAHIL